jgi:ribosome recycling factor
MSFDFSEFRTQASKALDHLVEEVSQLRTGKASAQLLDTVTVEAYGARMKLQEVAAVSVPDSNMILISPWDKSLIGAIEKGINTANLNLSPVVDGSLIRVVVPALTEERRKDMVKLLHQKLESGRVNLRSVRMDTKKDIDHQKGQPGISEDTIETDLEELDSLLKEYLAKVDDLGQRKEQELMTI